MICPTAVSGDLDELLLAGVGACRVDVDADRFLPLGEDVDDHLLALRRDLVDDDLAAVARHEEADLLRHGRPRLVRLQHDERRARVLLPGKLPRHVGADDLRGTFLLPGDAQLTGRARVHQIGELHVVPGDGPPLVLVLADDLLGAALVVVLPAGDFAQRFFLAFFLHQIDFGLPRLVGLHDRRVALVLLLDARRDLLGAGVAGLGLDALVLLHFFDLAGVLRHHVGVRRLRDGAGMLTPRRIVTVLRKGAAADAESHREDGELERGTLHGACLFAVLPAHDEGIDRPTWFSRRQAS